MGRHKPEIKADHFTHEDRITRDRLAECNDADYRDEAACDEIIEQGKAEVQATWSERERRNAKHYTIPEVAEGTHGHNRKPEIGRNH